MEKSLFLKLLVFAFTTLRYCCIRAKNFFLAPMFSSKNGTKKNKGSVHHFLDSVGLEIRE